MKNLETSPMYPYQPRCRGYCWVEKAVVVGVSVT